MNQNKIIIVNIVFNMLRKVHVPPRPKPEVVLTKAWIENRMKIFMKYTLKSLKKQINQNFIALVRYEASTEQLIKEELNKYPKLPGNIVFVKNHEIDHHINIRITDHQTLYLARIDSDDMYHKSFIQQLHDFQPNPQTKTLINRYGYVYDTIQNRMSTYYKSSPPFYTLIYNTADYIKGVRYSFKSHRHVIELPHEFLNERNFIVNIHSKNTSSIFNHDKNKLLTPRETRDVLLSFIG